MKIIPSKKFIDEAQKILKKDPKQRVKLEKTLNLIRTNIKYPSLRLHKLSGTENYSVSMDKSLRIIIHLEGENIFLLKIGTHEEVY